MPSDLAAALTADGPLPRHVALAALDRAAALMTTADFLDAGRIYRRVIGFDDPTVTAAAMLGLGEAFYRLDDDAHALATWEEATRLPETPSTYAAWRNVAAARVRGGDLRGAIAAYREAHRRAPGADKAEIASRLGWLSKESGDKGAAGRYFAKARGDAGFSFAVVVVAVTAIVSLVVNLAGSAGTTLGDLLAMDKVGLAGGEFWRLWTVTLVHAPLQQMPLHLLFNLYALWLAGPFVERFYGRTAFVALYLLFALGGSLGTFAFGDARFGVGASGAIFGMFGLLFAVQVVHRPVLDRAARSFLGQMGGLIAINLLLGFVLRGVVDNWAHIGGLVTGLWIGLLLPPTRVPSLRSMWTRPGPTPGTVVPAFGASGARTVRVVGLVALAGFLLLLWTLGSAAWGVRPS